MKRYSPRTMQNPVAQERLLLYLKQHVERFRVFFQHNLDDSQQPDDLWSHVFRFSSCGDWYLNSDLSQLVYIFDRAGTRHGGILHYNAPADAIVAATSDAFSRCSYHKIKAETHDERALVDAGYIITGVSPNDGLFAERWLPTIHLETLNPQWEDPGDDGLSHRHDRHERKVANAAATGILRAAAAAIRSFCGNRFQRT